MVLAQTFKKKNTRKKKHVLFHLLTKGKDTLWPAQRTKRVKGANHRSNTTNTNTNTGAARAAPGGAQAACGMALRCNFFRNLNPELWVRDCVA